MNCKIIKNIIFIILGYLLIKTIVKLDEKFTDVNKTNNITTPYIIHYPKLDSTNIIKVDEDARALVLKAQTNSKLRDIINNKMVEFYGELQHNKKLQDTLKFLNLINENNMPMFINEYPDNLMFNQVKILLIIGKIDNK